MAANDPIEAGEASLSRVGRPPLPIVPHRYWERWAAAVAIIAVTCAVLLALSRADIAYGDVPGFFASSIMIEGLWHTIVLAIVAQLLGIALGLVAAVMRISINPVARVTGAAYVWIFRGVPVLLQLLLWYNLALAFKMLGIPGLFSVPTNVVMTPFVAGLLGLGLNESAYMAEIIRAGFSSVDKGQIEAAHAIGMTPGKTLRRVILPQAMRVIIPPTGNDFINMLKATSLVSVISYVELIQAADNISSHNLETIETLLAAAAWYMVLVTLAGIGQHFIERHFSAGSQRRPAAAPRAPLRQSLVRTLGAAPFRRG